MRTLFRLSTPMALLIIVFGAPLWAHGLPKKIAVVDGILSLLKTQLANDERGKALFEP
jgi:hypothetical protein